MKIKTFKYFAKESVKSIKRNRVMSLASITTVAAALFIFGIFMLILINVNRVVNTVENKVEIKAFLKDDITTLKSQGIEKDIEAIKGVKSVDYESKEDALKKFTEQLGENKDLAKGLEMDNPLPASFIIKVDKPEDVLYVSGEIAKMDGIEKVNDGQQVVDKIVKITGFIKALSLALMAILGVIAVSLISNTIKLTVYARKKEIGIMKYIGATDWFVRWPFILEGILLGLLGAVVSIVLLGLGYGYAAKFVSTNVIIFSLVPSGEIMKSLAWQFGLFGMAIGGIGSMLSIRKFLVI